MQNRKLTIFISEVYPQGTHILHPLPMEEKVRGSNRPDHSAMFSFRGLWGSATALTVLKGPLGTKGKTGNGHAGSRQAPTLTFNQHSDTMVKQDHPQDKMDHRDRGK